MKTRTIIIYFVLFISLLLDLNAQEATPLYKHGFELSISSNLSTPAQQGGMLIYKRYLENKALRLGIYAERLYQPDYLFIQIGRLASQQDSGTTRSVGLRLGIEKTKSVSPKIDFFYAFDVMAGISQGKLISREYENGSIIFPQREKIRDIFAYQLGFVPHAGLRLWASSLFGFHLQVQSRVIAELSKDRQIPENQYEFSLDQFPLFLQGGIVARF